MKFTCTRENITHALDVVSGLAGKQSHLPILENILITAKESMVELAATNLEVAVRTSLRAKISTPGSFTVPAKTLGDYIRLLTGEQVEISLDGHELLVSCGSSSTKMKGVPADEYPVLPEANNAEEYGMLSLPFKESLSQVVIAAAKNEIRPELSGVSFAFFSERYKGLVLAATDSYRLAEKQVSVARGTMEASAIVPARTVYELVRLLGLKQEGSSEVTLILGEGQIVVRSGSFELVSRLIDGKYPDYAQIIPTEFKTTATLPVDLIQKNIKAASLFSTIGINAVSFDVNVEAGTVAVSSTSTQKGEHSSEIEAEVEGEENSILLNHRYVLDGLQHMSTDQVVFSMNSPDAPCLFRPASGQGYVYIVMPIRQ